MHTKAGVGMSHHRNPMMAGREAVEMALKDGGIEKPDFVFMFATVGYNQQALLKSVREASGGAPLCGCSGEGTMMRGEVDESNFSLVVMAISSDQLGFINGMGTGLKIDSGGLGQNVAETIRAEMGSDALALFLFADGLTFNFDRFLSGLEGALNLEGLLPLIGGAAADNWQLTRTYQYCDDKVFSDGVSWALLSGDARIACAVNHGCIATGVAHKITRSEENTIYEIDDRPALEVLKEYLTDDEIVDWAKAVIHLTLGFETPGHMEGYDDYMIRFMPTKDDEKGSFTIPTEVVEGTRIWMTRRDYDKVTQGVDHLAARINEQLGENPAQLVFQFDCCGRGKVFLREHQKTELLDRLQQQIPDAPWVGFYTLGEIGPVGKFNCFHNYTAVIAAVY